MRSPLCLASVLGLWVTLSGCESASEPPDPGLEETEDPAIEARLEQFTSVALTTDLDALSESDRTVLRHLIRAAREMEGPFWEQTYGDRDALFDRIDDPDVRRYAEIHYGPWDRLAENEPFVEGIEAKNPGANLYPEDMSREELETAAASSPELAGLYTLVRRDDAGELQAIPYSVAFESAYGAAAAELRAAAEATDDAALARYLELRADALLSDDYRESDMAWMEMKDNRLDIVIGPIETYEDELFGYKAANEALVLVKDLEWSERLSRYTTLLPELQKTLPVEEAYKRETPGLDSDLNAYDVVYYAGEANAGVKAIAVNLPNDEQVQLEKGTRRLQLKNAMRAKFDQILMPIAGLLVADEQRELVRFDAFFENVMFHEVAHGLGVKNTLDGSGTVRSALKERASALEEAKADVLGLFMVRALAERGELEDDSIADNYVTFIASIYRSVRFGAADAHGRANLMQLNFLEERGAFTHDTERDVVTVHLEAMESAVEELAGVILELQGDGDYEGVGAFMDTYQVMTPELERSLERLARAGIPVDIVFAQGEEVLGL